MFLYANHLGIYLLPYYIYLYHYCFFNKNNYRFALNEVVKSENKL